MKRQIHEVAKVDPILLSKQGAASALGVSVRTIDNMLKGKVLRPVKIGKRTMIRYADLLGIARRGGAETQAEAAVGA